MERAALFVHPSPRETFGVVAVEALASGLPVAAMPSGGVDEILGRDGAYGEVAEAPTAEALAGAIGRALDRRAVVRPARLRAHAERHYAAPAVAARLIALYRAMLPTIPGPDRADDATTSRHPPSGCPRSSSACVAADGPPAWSALAARPRGGAPVVLTSAGTGPTGGTVGPQLGSFGRSTPRPVSDGADATPAVPSRAAAGPLRVRSAIRHPIRARNLRRLARARPELASGDPAAGDPGGGPRRLLASRRGRPSRSCLSTPTTSIWSPRSSTTGLASIRRPSGAR